MISADRMKSVRIAPLTCILSSSTRVGHGVDQLFLMFMLVEQFLDDLLGRLERQIGAADHQQRRGQERREGGEQERRRKQEQRSCCLKRSPGDLADDRQLALGSEADDVARRDGGIVDDHASGLGARLAGRAGDVVERGSGELGDGGNVVEEGDEIRRASRRR